MGNEDDSAKLPPASTRIDQYGKAGLDAFNKNIAIPIYQLNAAVKRARLKNQAVRENDALDPLQRHKASIRDIRFLPDRKIDPSSLKRVILLWKDSQGHIIYTERDMSLNEIRALRDEILAESAVWGTLTKEQQAQFETEFKSKPSQKGTTSLHPFQDFLQSRSLGERFTQLQQRPEASATKK